MKKTFILLFILIAVSLFYYFFSKNNNKSSINIESREFVVEDMDDIAYLTIKSTAYPLMHLKKKSKDNWILNETYKADNNVVNNMIGVLSNMEIMYIPTKATNDNVIKNLPKVGMEIKAYDKAGNILTDFIMGSNDNKEGATFCVRRGFNQAYAMHVKVTEGGLRNYFDQSQINLRDKTVYDVNYEDFKSVKINYVKNKKNSFEITTNNGSYDVTPLEVYSKIEGQPNANVIEAYLKDFDHLYCEAIKTGAASMDSIRQFLPFAELEFVFNNEKKETYVFYPLIDILDNEVNTQTVTDLNKVERFLVYKHDGNVYMVQLRLLKNLFKPIDYFYK